MYFIIKCIDRNLKCYNSD